MTGCCHPCLLCWLAARRQAVGRWVFRHMPVGWRHRRVMREAMCQRREWLEYQLFAELTVPRYGSLTGEGMLADESDV